MRFDLPPLPYSEHALEPYVCASTLRVHHGQHHAGYLRKLEGLIGDQPIAKAPLAEIVCSTEGEVFDNAAQAWNHDFYWRSMKPGGGGEPRGDLGAAVCREFGDFDSFRSRFVDLGVRHFASGWLWLVAEGDRAVLLATANADTPVRRRMIPLLTVDLWEHAYYLDYLNQREKYLARFVDRLANWSFAEENWKARSPAPRGSGIASSEGRS